MSTALDVWKNPRPGTLSEQRTVAESAPIPAAPWERMTHAAFAAWISEQSEVPEKVSRRQLKHQLIIEGLDVAVEAILAGMGGADGKIARNWYAESVEFEISHALVPALARVIWPDPDHDEPFRVAKIRSIWLAASKL